MPINVTSKNSFLTFEMNGLKPLSEGKKGIKQQNCFLHFLYEKVIRTVLRCLPQMFAKVTLNNATTNKKAIYYIKVASWKAFVATWKKEQNPTEKQSKAVDSSKTIQKAIEEVIKIQKEKNTPPPKNPTTTPPVQPNNNETPPPSSKSKEEHTDSEDSSGKRQADPDKGQQNLLSAIQNAKRKKLKTVSDAQKRHSSGTAGKVVASNSAPKSAPLPPQPKTDKSLAQKQNKSGADASSKPKSDSQLSTNNIPPAPPLPPISSGGVQGDPLQEATRGGKPRASTRPQQPTVQSAPRKSHGGGDLTAAIKKRAEQMQEKREGQPISTPVKKESPQADSSGGGGGNPLMKEMRKAQKKQRKPIVTPAKRNLPEKPLNELQKKLARQKEKTESGAQTKQKKEAETGAKPQQEAGAKPKKKKEAETVTKPQQEAGAQTKQKQKTETGAKPQQEVGAQTKQKQKTETGAKKGKRTKSKRK